MTPLPRHERFVTMDFPIVDLLSDELATEWLLQHFHPDGLKCPHCQTSVEEARSFRQTGKSNLSVYLISARASTTFTAIRCSKGSTSTRGKQFYCCAESAKENLLLPLLVKLVYPGKRFFLFVELFRTMPLISNPKPLCQTHSAVLCDANLPRRRRTKCFRMRKKKNEPHLDPTDPPRRRANKRRGHGTYENDRPPIIGTVGRESGQVRLRMIYHTDSETLKKHVHERLRCRFKYSKMSHHFSFHELISVV